MLPPPPDAIEPIPLVEFDESVPLYRTSVDTVRPMRERYESDGEGATK